MLLTEEFISQYPESPKQMNQLSSFVFYRTYSRFIEKLDRRETWKEAVRRAVEYNVSLELKHKEKLNIRVDIKKLRKEAEQLFDNVFNLKQFLSGRTHWVGGADTKAAEKYPLANFNCSYVNVTKWDDLGDLFYLLLVGTGVGFRCTKEAAKNLPKLRTDVNLIHAEYKPVPVNNRLEFTEVMSLDNGFMKVYIGDSKEGWVQALRLYFNVLSLPEYEGVHTIKFSYNSIREKGERLKTFGGTASGHEPLQEMFEGFDKILKNQLDPSLAPIVDGQLRPVHILDMGNLIGYNVVVGGVRRTAEIFLCDADDWESILAKYGINGIWSEEQYEHHKEVGKKLEEIGQKPAWFDELTVGKGRNNLNHRRMSNNSIAFVNKPSRDMLSLVFSVMRGEGEPGFVNLEQAAKRRLKGMGIKNPDEDLVGHVATQIGLNPCAEILLDSYGVCNLTTVNLDAFVNKGELDIDGLDRAQQLSARAGLRMTLVDLELPHWNEVQKRDRLLGTSLTGFKDAMAKLKADFFYEEGLLRGLGRVARETADAYAKELRIACPLLVSTVKPEGTLSQVAGGVSSGLHWSHSPYYIRRIRINATDPLVGVIKELGWTMNPEVGTKGKTHYERMVNAKTFVVDFPVASGARRTKDDVSVKEQFQTYFNFQQVYTEHNSSNTISVKPDEWEEAEQIVWDNWDNFVGVSFLSHDGGTYELAPYEAITKERYEEMVAGMKPFDHTLLQKYEGESSLDGMDACEGGACPIR